MATDASEASCDPWGNLEATYTVLTTGKAVPHLCGYNLSAKFPDAPLHTVVQCDIDGRCWIHHKKWADGTSDWRWETFWERRRREKRG